VKIDSTVYARFMRPAFVLGGLLVYVAFTWSLVQTGLLRASESAFMQLTVVWVLGFVLLTFWQTKRSRGDDESLVLCRVIWCNLGVVTMAVLVPHSIRLLMLVVPLFGVFYAAVHLSSRQVVLIALATWLVYAFCDVVMASFTNVDLEFQALSGLAFAFLLLGAGLLSWEVLRIRSNLEERNSGLQSAMGRLQEMALRDELTGVHNRRYILDVLARQKALSDRGQQQFTLCYCDLDHFKQVNDRFGHAVGDRALKQFAELALSVVRNVDYVARFGGEEFLMVLIDADEAAAARVARRLADRTREMWVHGTGRDFSMTVSVGITQFRPGERVEDALNRADRSLYEAKITGRDRVVVSSARKASAELAEPA
jgi:diguanylate cyclase (GGDEF)-like protein